MIYDFFECKTVLIAAGDEFVADLPQHTLLLIGADLDLLITDKGACALLSVKYSQNFQLRICFANGVGIYLQMHGQCSNRGQLLTGKEPVVNSAAIRVARLPKNYSSRRAEQELGYTRRPVEESARDAWEWFREYGYAR